MQVPRLSRSPPCCETCVEAVPAGKRTPCFIARLSDENRTRIPRATSWCFAIKLRPKQRTCRPKLWNGRIYAKLRIKIRSRRLTTIMVLSLVKRDRRNSGEDVDCLVHGYTVPLQVEEVKFFHISCANDLVISHPCLRAAHLTEHAA